MLSRFKQFNYSIESIFLVIALLAGTFFVFITPIYYVPDEQWHYARVLQIANGNLGLEKRGNTLGASLDKSQASFAVEGGNLTALSSLSYNLGKYGRSSGPKNVFVKTGATYSPIAYVPQAIGVVIAKVFGLGQALTFYVSRFASLLMYIFLMYFAIKIAPFAKWFYFTVGLLPMSLSLASSVSADQLVLASIALAVAYYLTLFDKQKLSMSEATIIIGSAMVISLMKAPYSIVLLMFALLPQRMFKDRKAYFAFLLSLVASILVFNFGWNYFVGTYSGAEVTRAMFPTLPANPGQQISSIVASPAVFLIKFVYSFFIQGSYYLSSMIGILGQGNLVLNSLVYFLYTILLTLTLLLDSAEQKSIYWYHRLFSGGLIISLIGFISIVMYLTWTAVGATLVRGVQGRYFLPLLFLVPIATNGILIKKIEMHKVRLKVFLVIVNSILLADVLISLYHYYN